MSDVMVEARVGGPWLHRAKRMVTPRLISRLTLFVAASLLLGMVNPRFIRRLHLPQMLETVHPAEPALAAAAAVLLIALARSLARGKRRAWMISLLLLVPQMAIQAHIHHRTAAIAALLLSLLLIVGRDNFSALSDPSTRWLAPRVGLAMFTGSTLIGWLAVTLLNDEVHGGFTPQRRLLQTLKGLIGIPTMLTEPTGRLQDAIYYLLLGLGVTTVGVTAFLLLRNVRVPGGLTAEDEERLRAVMRRQADGDSLDYFATRGDRSCVWSPSGGACVSFRVIAGTALAVGDPIGPRAQWPDAIGAFMARCREYGWIPAVVATSTDGAHAWRRWGELSILEFGDEAIVHADEFTLEGRDMRNVRHAVGRAQRAGQTVEISRLGDLDPEVAKQLAVLADAWRVGDVERGFSMALGRFDHDRDPQSLVVTAVQDGQPVGLLVFVPWGRDGLSLDLMRRHPDADSVNELMIATLMERVGDYGVRQVSLNFAAFRDAIERAERIGAGPIARAWGRLLRMVSAWSQADSLYRFNAKFRPEWRPRYIGFPSASGLPRLAIAYLGAESLVTLPRPHLRRRTA